MKFVVTLKLFSQRGNIRWRELVDIMDDFGQQLWKNYDPNSSWYFDPRDRQTVIDTRQRLRALLPPDMHIREVVFLDEITADDVCSAKFVGHHIDDVLPGISDGILPHDYPATCSVCENKYLPADADFHVPIGKLKQRKFMITFLKGCLQLVCTAEFRRWYEDAGLTGLSFLPVKESMSRALYRVQVVQHQWTDRSGVCLSCVMKTNVTTFGGVSYLDENYHYDFQFVRIWNDTRFIISQRAFQMAQATKGLSLPLNSDTMPRPMVPGCLSDLIRPEDRICTPGNPPMRMLTY